MLKLKNKNPQAFNNIWIYDFGLVTYEELPYIAALPDFDLECKCCGAGLVETKCP